MKIVIVNPFFTPWAPGGAEHSLEQMSDQFTKIGWQVDILAASVDNREPDEKRGEYRVRWVRAPFDREPGQSIDAETFFRARECQQLMLRRFGELERPDIVIANNAQMFDMAMLIGSKYRLPTIGIIRDTQIMCEFGACMDNKPAFMAHPCEGHLGAAQCSVRFQRVRGVKGWRPLPAWFLYGVQMHGRRQRRRAAVIAFDHIVTISDALGMLLPRALPNLAREKLSTIRNFATQADIADPEAIKKFLEKHDLGAGRFFLFAGRKTYGKGADIFQQAISILKGNSIDCRGLLLGRGKLTGDRGSECVDVDSVPQELLLGILEKSTALIIPGRWQEGLHRTMIDAIRIGKPVICSEAGAPPLDGVQDGSNGLVVPCNNPLALAEAMAEVLNWNRERTERCLKTSAKIFSDRFSDEVLIGKWSQLLLKFVH